jgi:hypothetical protein
MPTWNELRETIQSTWKAAATAIIANSPQNIEAEACLHRNTGKKWN